MKCKIISEKGQSLIEAMREVHRAGIADRKPGDSDETSLFYKSSGSRYKC